MFAHSYQNTVLKKPRTIFTILLIALISFLTYSAYCQEPPLSYYLPSDVSYNENIPTPASVIGHEVGEWHITHDKLVYYMKQLADASDRIILEQIGTSHEGRPQLILTISHPDNLAKIDKIRKRK